jgi:hypothetical protein
LLSQVRLLNQMPFLLICKTQTKTHLSISFNHHWEIINSTLVLSNTSASLQPLQ